jgi:phosphatidylserine decarboxylase
MTIHKEGYRIIFIILMVLVAIVALINIFFPVQTPWHYLLYLAGIVFFALVVRFFRYPDRSGTVNDHQILSAADGKIVQINEVKEEEYFKDQRIQVSVFMSLVNVHVNWYPVSGTIKYFKYHPGKYLFAWNPKSSLDNERNTTVIKTAKGDEVLVRQIAGGLARRIVDKGEVGKKIKQRDELGIIKFGSRVDFFLPLNTKIKVKMNQKVRGCETVIGELGE